MRPGHDFPFTIVRTPYAARTPGAAGKRKDDILLAQSRSSAVYATYPARATAGPPISKGSIAAPPAARLATAHRAPATIPPTGAHRHQRHHHQQEANATWSLVSLLHPVTDFVHRVAPQSRIIEVVLFAATLSLCLVMWVVARRVRRAEEQPLVDGVVDERPKLEQSYRELRNLYLSVYALATFGDWIQGGFLYALYAEYGYSQRDIGLIFVAGYASAMTIGTYVSALGDIGGHKRNCVAYGILYAGSCALCNFKSLPLLLLGRILGGISCAPDLLPPLISALRSALLLGYRPSLQPAAPAHASALCRLAHLPPGELLGRVAWRTI